MHATVKVSIKTKGKLKPISKQTKKLELRTRKIIGLYVDKLNEGIKENCPSPSLKRAFYVTSTISKKGQIWYIAIKDLQPVSKKKGRNKIPNELSTYEKVMAVEYGRPIIPRRSVNAGRVPLFSSVSIGHTGVSRYMGTMKGVSPKAKELRDSKPSVLIRVGPFAAVPPTFFIQTSVCTWEPIFRKNIIREIDSLLGNKNKK
jgi:hypothetical protein